MSLALATASISCGRGVGEIDKPGAPDMAPIVQDYESPQGTFDQSSVAPITEVIETPQAYLVFRPRGRFPVRIPRENVVRQRTDCDRWFEVVSIERV